MFSLFNEKRFLLFFFSFHRVSKCSWSCLVVLMLLHKRFVSLPLVTSPCVGATRRCCLTEARGHYAMSICKACASQMEGHMLLTNLWSGRREMKTVSEEEEERWTDKEEDEERVHVPSTGITWIIREHELNGCQTCSNVATITFHIIYFYLFNSFNLFLELYVQNLY